MRGITWPSFIICAFSFYLLPVVAYTLECSEHDDTVSITFAGDANGFVIEGIQGRILSKTDERNMRLPFDGESKEPKKLA